MVWAIWLQNPQLLYANHLAKINAYIKQGINELEWFANGTA